MTVFSEKGYHQATVADVIAAAGVARGTFYLYFESKQQVFETILEALFKDLTAVIERVEVDQGTAHALTMLQGNVERVFATLLDDPRRGRILLHTAAGVEGAVDAQLDQFYQGVLALLGRSLRTGMGIGLVRQVEVDTVAHALIGSCKEVIRWAADERAPDRAIVIHQLLVYNIRGLLAETYVRDLRDDALDVWAPPPPSTL